MIVLVKFLVGLAVAVFGVVNASPESCYGQCFAFYDGTESPEVLLAALGGGVICNKTTTMSCSFSDGHCVNTKLYVSAVDEHWDIGSFQCLSKNETESSLCTRLKLNAKEGQMNVYNCQAKFCDTDNCNDLWKEWSNDAHSSQQLHTFLILILVFLLGEVQFNQSEILFLSDQ